MKNCTACSQMHSLQRNACFTLCSTDETWKRAVYMYM
jgi:hypothetical protein